ncbi:efflux RND transporter permease subunit [Agilicoccus flavus]|uniref:efflux RND transporter permease subunit n=1 Tax=Agilicoccus flavus TaxID=2775968 RepID=UPI001CF669B1|nr:efflux RND transporter permease subunit [Agilicoccus flavus]
MTLLTRLSLANRAVVALLTLLVVGVGLFATTSLKQELFPSLDLPGTNVVASYPGASPEVVEREVTEPLEDAVKGVAGVTKVTSTSMAGVSQVSLQWDFGADDEAIRADVESALGRLGGQLPDGVDPQTGLASFDDVPIVALSVSSDQDSAALSTKLEDVAVPALSGLDGVTSVSVSGARANEVVVTFRPQDVTRYGVQTAQLQQVLQAAGAAVPGGQLQAGGKDVNVQVGRALSGVEDVANLRLTGTDGQVALSQVADVKLAPEPLTSISRTNGRPSLGLAVVKESDGNTVAVAREVREALPGLATQLGGDVRFDTVFDQAPFIEQSIHDLSTEGLLGLAFAVVVIFVFLLSFSSTLIAAISIPLSLLIAMIGLWQSDQTLNIFTLGALTVAIGRVVDDSIVVIENIKRHLGRGERGPEAIVGAVREVAGAVTASTITTVAVFLPLGLVGGEVGELFRPFALTVTIALLASLLVALTIVPVLAWWFMRPRSRRARATGPRARRRAERAEAKAEAARARQEAQREKATARFEAQRDKLVAKLERKGASPERIDTAVDDLRARHHAYAPVVPGSEEAAGLDAEHAEAQNGLQRAYLPVLRWSLGHRALTLVFAMLLLLGTFALVPRLKTDFLGDAGQNSLRVSQELPPGSSLAATDAAAKKVEAALRADPAVRTVQATIGSGGAQAAALGFASGGNTASMSVMLAEGTDGPAATTRLQAAVEKLSGVGEVTVSAGGGGAGNQDVTVNVSGNDLASLRTGTDRVVAAMQGVSGLGQVRSDLSQEGQVLQVDIDPTRAARYGMSQADIGAAVRAAISGAKAGQVRVEDETQDILVRSQEPVTTLAQLRALQLPVTQTMTANARKAAGERVADRQQAAQDEQAAEAKQQARDQIEKLRDGREQAAEQADALEDQLQALRRAATNPVPPVPTDPRAALAQQVAQLEKQAEAARDQVRELDEQITSAQDQLAESDAKAAEARALADDAQAAQEAEATPRTLAQVATIRQVGTPATVTRVDGVRSVTVTATPSGGDLGATTQQLQSALDATRLPAGVSASVGGVSQDQQEAFRQLGLAMLVAIAIVFLVMVATFRSLVQPLILLVSIPFAATGAIALLLLTDTPLGLPAMIGLLMLIGIVVTNAIVLIDLVNQYRERGVGIDAAIVDGARLRLRPILMTALATICALVPMSIGLTGGGVFISKPLAIVVIGGLVSSTLLTLVLVPVLYDLVERVRLRRGRRRGGDADPTDAPDIADPSPTGGESGAGESARRRIRYVPRPE